MDCLQHHWKCRGSPAHGTVRRRRGRAIDDLNTRAEATVSSDAFALGPTRHSSRTGGACARRLRGRQRRSLEGRPRRTSDDDRRDGAGLHERRWRDRPIVGQSRRLDGHGLRSERQPLRGQRSELDAQYERLLRALDHGVEHCRRDNHGEQLERPNDEQRARWRQPVQQQSNGRRQQPVQQQRVELQRRDEFRQLEQRGMLRVVRPVRRHGLDGTDVLRCIDLPGSKSVLQPVPELTRVVSGPCAPRGSGA